MINLPNSVRRYLAGYTSTGDDLRTSSKAHVYFFRHATRRGRFLKIMDRADSPPNEADLEAERVALQWLQGQSWVPNLVHYCQQEETEYLITDEIAGRSSENDLFKADIPALLRLVAGGLKRIHALPLDDFPVDYSVNTLLAKVEQSIRLGMLQPEQCRRVGWSGSPQELLEYLHQTRPQSEESLFTHGDYAMPNILIQDGQVTGIVDWGYAGVGDRYRDFAAVVKSIGRNLGEQWVDLFFDEYGIGEVDQEKLKYHRLFYDLT